MPVCVSAGGIGDWDHQQIGPEAVWELGFCQRQAAVQILPERSGCAAAQTVAPLEKRRGGRGRTGQRVLFTSNTISLTATALPWSFHSYIHKHTVTHSTHTHLCTNIRSMHIGMHRHANTHPFCPWPLNNCCLGRKTEIPPDAFTKGPLILCHEEGARESGL